MDCLNKVGICYVERTVKNHHVHVREFVDMDAGCHFKWVRFTLSNKEYPIGSFDIIRRESIDWTHTKVAKS